MKFTAMIEIEVPDSLVEFVGQGKTAEALAVNISQQMKDFRESNSELVKNTTVTIELDDGRKVGLGWADAKPSPTRSVASFDSQSATLSAPRRQPEGMGPAKRPGIRTGRPATLHDHFASDGQPVRAKGPRSVESLTAQGVKVYRMVDGRKRLVTEQDGAVWTEGNATLPEATPKRSKNDRPPVITHRRGQ